MGEVEYFTNDGTVFTLHTIHNVCRMRFTDDKGNQTILEDSNMKKIINVILNNYEANK